MILVYYFVIMNILAFITYGIDKARAGKGQWRISEAMLILLAFFGGALGASLGMLIFHHKTRKRKFFITVPLLLALQLAFCIFALYQNYHLTVSSHEVDLGLSRELKIVQVSDLHNQFFGLHQERLLKMIEEQSPDMIFVTGDLIDSSTHTSYSLAMEFIRGAVKIAPVYYVTGNHEVRLEEDKLRSCFAEMESLGVNMMDDRFIEYDEYIIAGIADISLMTFDKYEPFDDSKPVIMLAHEPQYTGLYKRLGADLVFTGHYHGGQIIIPGVGALITPEFEFFPAIYQGLNDYEGMKYVISRGLGNSAVPVRVNDYPEIVTVTVK
ncbi:MAG: DUF1294 domain-containing protein [Clostridiales bacterium]|nr:DUF1294 domain-containing protein [Clostridiales bacterium]